MTNGEVTGDIRSTTPVIERLDGTPTPSAVSTIVRTSTHEVDSVADDNGIQEARDAVQRSFNWGGDTPSGS